MKTKILFAIALFISFYNFAQTNGWYLYTKANTVNKIIPDDVNANELHLATDIGYIKYNTTTNTVSNFLNLTSQDPAIGHVNGLALNPINNNIALALDDGFAIYDGTTVTIYNYDNSALTVGSVGGTQFTKLEVRYGRQGELYIFKPDVTGYQTFNAGVFDVEVVTAIRPQDIIENQAGTKVFFAGWNNGLHMLEKATTTWTNYTASNSDLITNTLNSLHVDANDLLYVGGFQGLNTMTPASVWNTYQQLVPPANIWFYPVYDISLNESNGDLLIQTSSPNNSNFGLSTLELATNTWTNYTDDNTNCLNTNNFRASAIGNDGNIYASKTFSANSGSLFKFNNATNTCSEPDINYLNAPTVANSNLLSDFTVRRKTSGNLDIGFTRGENLHILEINPDTFKGTFPAATTITPALGKSAFSVLSDNDFFIVETNTGWVFVDGANNTTEFTHNLPNYLAITTQKAAAFDSDNGIINLVHKGFDAAFNYRVYKTQCNTATATCSVPEEMFTNNRDFTKNIFFDTHLNPITNIVSVVALKTGGVAAGKFTKKTSKSKVFGPGPEFTSEGFDSTSNGAAVINFDEPLPFTPKPSSDPWFFRFDQGGDPLPCLLDVDDNLRGRQTDPVTNVSSYVSLTIDGDNDGTPEEILGVGDFKPTTINPPPTIVYLFNPITKTLHVLPYYFSLTLGFLTVSAPEAIIVPLSSGFNLIDAKLVEVGPPVGNQIQKTQNQNEAVMVLLTNYGMLIKTGIDISSLTLSVDDVSLKNSNLLLYPNPANDIVSFSNNSIKIITVYDINGRKVLSTTNSNSFSVKTLAQGVYIVKGTRDNNVVVTKKLIVE
jgi:hypothetical protein